MFPSIVFRAARVTVTLMAATVVLSACTGKELRTSLGLKRNDPDEFQVVSRPPLSVPPVYHLRPPAEDEKRNIVPANERAKSLVFDNKELPVYQRPDDAAYHQAETAVDEVESSGLGTTGESMFLRNAGAGKAESDIRKLLRAENAPIIREEKREKGILESVTSKLRPGEGEPVVDAKKEQERIRTNQAEGKPINEGETPVIDPKDETVLDKLL